MTIDVPIRLLVTDKGVRVISTEDEERLRELIQEAVSWENARVVEIREVTIPVTLPEVPAATRVDPKPSLNVPQDVREMVETELAKRQLHDRDQAWSILMDALAPGLYRITRDAGSRGMRRED